MRIAALAFAIAGLNLASCSQPLKPNAPPSVVIDKMTYGPAPAHLHEGDTLVWSDHDILRHTATARDGSFDVDLAPGSNRSVRLTHVGAIDVYCRYHPGMALRLMVEPRA